MTHLVLTNPINIIERGTPQYWFDPKSGKVFTKTPAGDAVIAFPGYVDEVDERKVEEIIRDSYAKQSDGLLSDYYGGTECAGSFTTPNSKSQQLTSYGTQKSKDNIKNIYDNVPALTENKIGQLKQNLRQQRNPQSTNDRKLFQARSWLHVPMPIQFNYTGAIIRNYSQQGLLHSYLRHSAEWYAVIRGLEKIPPIQQSLQNIGAATPSNARARLNQFEANMMTMSDGDIETLSDIQMRIYDFLRTTIASANYLGEGINDAGRQQVYFEVPNGSGNTQVMVVCVSEQLYNPDRDFDSRPIRTITTVFFMPKTIAQRRIIRKLF